jgi:hypothetical protein
MMKYTALRTGFLPNNCLFNHEFILNLHGKTPSVLQMFTRFATCVQVNKQVHNQDLIIPDFHSN